jgi:hypothetical protein
VPPWGRRGESERVAGVVVGHLVVADLDGGGDIGEGSASAAAATLPISSRAVTSGNSSASGGTA